MNRSEATEEGRHLTDDEVAAYLDGELSGRERARLGRHLATCPACAHQVAATATLLAEAGLLPPPRIYHPLERLLMRLQLLVPLPLWVLHVLLESLTYFLWAVTVARFGPISAWHGTAGRVLTLWPILLATTTHLILLQPRLRDLVRDLWRAGVDERRLRAVRGRIALLQGWPLGGIWFFVFLDIVNNSLNVVEVGGLSGGYIRETVIGLYEGLAFLSLVWGTLIGGSVLGALATALSGASNRETLLIARGARLLGLSWVAVVSVGVAAYLRVAVTFPVSNGFFRGWIVAITLILFWIWYGYARIEWQALRWELATPRQGVAVSLRLVFGLLLIFIPLALSQGASL